MRKSTVRILIRTEFGLYSHGVGFLYEKGWLVFLLLLIITAQLFVLSSFREIDIDGFTSNVSVVGLTR